MTDKTETDKINEAAYRDQGLLSSLETSWLFPDNCRFERGSGGFLNLHIEGQVYKRIAVHRCFPFSATDEFLSIREAEDMGESRKEIGMIEKLGDWPDDTQEMLREQLAIRYFMPKIIRVLKIKEEFGFSAWAVETDRGPADFTVRGGSGSIFSPSRGRHVITDIDGNRYTIDDIETMSTKERKQLDLYI